MAKLLPELKQHVDQYELVPSGGGRFEVFLGEKQVYSKLETGRFPDEEALVATIRRAIRK